MRKPRRGGAKPSKRWDLSDLQAVMKDPRTHVALGRVFKPDSASAHWFVAKGRKGDKNMVMVEVETLPDLQDLTCRLATKPHWYIPNVGELVAVAIPAGEVDHCPLIVGILDSGAAPADVSTDVMLVAPGRTWAVRSPMCMLGDTDATERAVKGSTWWQREEAKLTKAIVAVRMLEKTSGATGPTSHLSLAFGRLADALQEFKDAGSQEAYLAQQVVVK